MNKQEILVKIQDIFRNVLDTEQIVLTESTSADDIEGWTSLTHVQLITTMEQEFNIHFKLQEMMSWQNVGEIADSIIAKLG